MSTTNKVGTGTQSFEQQLEQLLDPNQQANHETDAELLAQFVECSNRLAIEKLIERYSSMVAAVCRLTTQHRDDAEDAFQATFLVLLQSARKVRKQGSIAAWLHGVAYRIAYRARVRRRKMADLTIDFDSPINTEQSDAAVDPVVIVARKMELERLVRELENLPTTLRATLAEHYLLGHSIREISERMEVSASAVEGRLRRGRRLLRTRLIGHGLSLSVVLVATKLLQQRVHATEGQVWFSHFVDQRLADTSGVAVGSTSVNVASLVQGEHTMFSQILMIKSTIGLALFAAAGSLATMALVEHGNNGASGQGQTLTIVAESASDLSTSNVPIVLGQAAEAFASSATDSGGGAGDIVMGSATDGNKGNLSATAHWEPPVGNKPEWLHSDDEDAARDARLELCRKHLRTTLKSPIKGNAVPFKNFLSTMGEENSFRFIFAEDRLAEEGIDLDSPVTIDIPACSLHQALSIILRPLSLTYRVREAAIEITTMNDSADEGGTLRYYDLSYLFSSSDHAGALVRTISQTISPDIWSYNGGSSTISMIGSTLLIRCPDSSHFEIEQLLREVAKMNPSNPTPSLQPVVLIQPASGTDGGMGGMGGGMGGMF